MEDRIIESGTWRMGRNGAMVRCEDRPELERGTIVWAVGPGCSLEKYAYTGEGDLCVLLGEPVEGDYFGPYVHIDRYALPISEKFGIGVYYDLDALQAGDGAIDEAIARADGFLAAQKKKEEEAAQEEERARGEARKEYAGVFSEGNDTTNVAKNIRKDLSIHFPGQKFSVRKNGYSSITVSWTDGPTEEEVRGIVQKHEMNCAWDKWNDDILNYSHTAFTSVFGGVQYLWLSRDYSPEQEAVLREEIRPLLDRFPEGSRISGDDFYASSDGQEIMRRYNWTPSSSWSWFSVDDIIRSILASESFYKAPEKRKTGESSTTGEKVAQSGGNGLSYVDYSERAFAVTGDTRPFSETLKGLGGRFNPRLSCGPGWIFPKTKEESVRQALTI